MPLLDTIGLVAGLGTEILKRVNAKELNKHHERMTELEKLIQEEKARGQLSDDGKIEAWEQEFVTEGNAFLRQLALIGVAK